MSEPLTFVLTFSDDRSRRVPTGNLQSEIGHQRLLLSRIAGYGKIEHNAHLKIDEEKG